MSMRHDLFNHPGGVLDAALRSLKRPEGRGHARTFLQTVHPIDLRTPAGLHLGQVTGYIANGARLFRVVERVVRGLFFNERRRPLGLASGVKVFEDSFVDPSRLTAQQLETIRTTAAVLATKQERRIGEVFRYSCLFTEEDERVSAWRLTFYGKVVFIAVTAPMASTS